MNFTLKDNNNKTLFTGTKQDCMHFIKRRALDRQSINFEPLGNSEPAPHYTVPIVNADQPKKGLFKRIFTK
jgi:hypothetical protein